MIKFTKMQAIGNDFVVVAKSDTAQFALPALARTLCERHFAVGSDGMLVIGEGATTHSLDFRMFNPDGSEDMCGNGLRCALLWAYRHGLVSIGRAVNVHGFDRDRECLLSDVSPDAKSATVTVDMGTADFRPANVPFVGPNSGERLSAYELKYGNRTVRVSPVSTGSTHAVIFLDDDVTASDFETLSPLIENDPYFPERTSIMWTVPEGNDTYRVRIWERAAAETLGCGTGATAIAAVAWAEQRSNPAATVTVRSKGGALTFRQSPAGQIQMTGPAAFVFDGTFA